MQRKIVTVILIFINDIFQPYTAIIRCPPYVNSSLTACLNFKFKIMVKIQIKIDRPIKLSKNWFDLHVGPISVFLATLMCFM
jgi:hypothetical protein